MAITWLDSCPSTQELAMEAGRAGEPGGIAFASRVQTAGVGRRGSAWQSPEGGLYISILKRPRVPMSMLMGVTTVATLAVFRALKAVGIADVMIKWPNDLVVGGRKLSGVIADAATSDLGMFVAIGIGVNVAPVSVPADGAGIALPATSVDEALASYDGDDATVSRFKAMDDADKVSALAGFVLEMVNEAVDDWSEALSRGAGAAGPLGPVMHEYFDNLWLTGERVEVVTPEGAPVMHGRLAGLDGWGRVTVVADDGSEHEFSSEQARLREA